MTVSIKVQCFRVHLITINFNINTKDQLHDSMSKLTSINKLGNWVVLIWQFITGLKTLFKFHFWCFLFQNGLYSMMPYIALGTVQFCSGFISDFLVKRKFINIFWARRMFCAICEFLFSPALIVFLCIWSRFFVIVHILFNESVKCFI